MHTVHRARREAVITDEGSALLYLFDPIFSLVSEFDESCLSSPREPRAQ